MDDLALRHHLYETTAATGRVPDVDELSQDTGLDGAEILAALGRLQDDHHALVLHQDRQRIWMLSPFAAEPTSFRVDSGDTTWYGNCVWDALSIPELVGVDALVSAVCPDCGEAIEVGVTADGRVGPVEAIAHFAVPAGAWWEDIGHT